MYRHLINITIFQNEWYFIQPIQSSYNKRYFKNMAGIINLIWSFEDKLFPGR